MEDIQGNVGEAGPAADDGKGIGKELNWTVLFVSDTGRVVRVPGFKRYVITAACVVVVSIIVAAVCLGLFLAARQDAKDLAGELDASKARIDALVDENDRLLARIAVMEETGSGAEEKKEEGESAQKAVKAGSDGKHAVADRKKMAASKESVAREPVLPVVSVENFRVVQTSDTEATRIEFAVKKIGGSPGYVSGHIFVVLEGVEGGEQRTMVVPPVYMKDGVPAETRRGQYFSIARYKPVTMKANISDPAGFQNATVYIFSTDGVPIYESTIPVKIVMEKPKEAPMAVEPAQEEATDNDNGKDQATGAKDGAGMPPSGTIVQ